MQATRMRFVSFLEWVVAGAVVAGIALLGSSIVRDIRTVNALTPVMADGARPDPAVPAGVPSRAVSVPMLLLQDGIVMRVGDRLTAVASRLGSALEVRPQAVEPTPDGERVTRFYEFAGARFVLVFEPFERRGEQRIAAIYVQ